MPYEYQKIESPVGTLTLVANGPRLAGLLWERDSVHFAAAASRGSAILSETRRQLDEYFEGRRTAFDLELEFAGTDFQKKVWAALLTIPFGETRNYAQIAVQIGNPNAVRAVGAANGRNPISIIAPCHRVIGTSGGLVGFGGGLENKRRLLALEATVAGRAECAGAPGQMPLFGA